ncbi:MAG TPA: tetratricopeptide repeat protein [Xanthomonadales bacterium]|nr:tetratricopeptide repeat protein [Xanthomonadales bacterium]
MQKPGKIAATETVDPAQGEDTTSITQPWQRTALRLGAAMAVVSASLAVLANLSEIAGWFSTDDTREIVEETRGTVQNTDAKVEELVTLLRNQAAASGLSLNLESEDTIRNAIQAIVASGNAQKQIALGHLDVGDVPSAARLMSEVAENQATAVSETSEAAAASWREAGALYYSLDIEQAINAYQAADQLEPDNAATLEMLGHSLVRAGRFDDAESALQHCLASSPTAELQVSALIGLGSIAKHRGRYDEAETHFNHALETAESHGLEEKKIHALQALAVIDREQGDLAASDLKLQQALAIAEAISDQDLIAKMQSSLGVQAAARQDWPEARRLISAALEIYRSRNDLAGQNSAVGNLGAIALSLGELETAETLLRESVEIGRKLGWQSSVATDLINIATIAAKRGDFAAAAADFDQAEALALEHELGELQPVITFNRGEMAIQQENVAAACGYWGEAQPQLQAMGSVYLQSVESRLAEFDCAISP